MFDPLKYSGIIRFIRNMYAMYSVSYRYNQNTTNPYLVQKQSNPNPHNFYSFIRKGPIRFLINLNSSELFGFGTPQQSQYAILIIYFLFYLRSVKDFYISQQYLTKLINWGHMGAFYKVLLDKILEEYLIAQEISCVIKYYQLSGWN